MVILPSILICGVVMLTTGMLWNYLKCRGVNQSRKLVAYSSLAIMLVLCLSVSSYRVYSYMNPPLCTVVEKENYGRHFNDMQPRHISAARRYGITPIADRTEARERKEELGLVQVRNCRNYHLAPLTHSIPYLTENAEALLDRIGKNFRDSLASKRISSHKIIVTSVLRTEEDVKKLVKVNKNASGNSAHKYAATFDISYANFLPTGVSVKCGRNVLKKVLAEVLRDLRDSKACYVRYEKNQKCFHITSRK